MEYHSLAELDWVLSHNIISNLINCSDKLIIIIILVYFSDRLVYLSKFNYSWAMYHGWRCSSHFTNRIFAHTLPWYLCWSQSRISVHSKIHVNIINWIAKRHVSPLSTRYLIVCDPSSGPLLVLILCKLALVLNHSMDNTSTTRFCNTPQYLNINLNFLC